MRVMGRRSILNTGSSRLVKLLLRHQLRTAQDREILHERRHIHKPLESNFLPKTTEVRRFVADGLSEC